MASPIVAGVRAGMSPRDSAGSPSYTSPQQVTTASNQVREYFAHAAEVASNDIARRRGDAGEDFAAALLKLNSAAPRVHDAIRAAIQLLPNDTDADHSLAVLELASTAAREFSNDVFEVGALACLTREVQPVRPVQSHDRMAFEAAVEIEAISRMLRRQKDACDFESLLNGALIRIDGLAGVLMAVHGGDSGRELGEMHELVFGEPMEGADHE